MTAVTATVSPTELAQPSAADCWYDPHTERPGAPVLCYCGMRAAGYTTYGRGRTWPAPEHLKYQCAEHLPTAPAVYRLDDTCPYTHSHTREWCGRPSCRES